MSKEIDQYFLKELMNMGFTKEKASHALLVTGQKSLDDALEYLFRDSDPYEEAPPPVVKEKEVKEKGKAKQQLRVSHQSNNDSEDGDDDYSMENAEGDSDDYLDDEVPIYEESTPKVELSTVLDQRAIEASAAKEIERIASITETSLSTAGALLRAFQWNSEKLLEQYCDNPDRVLKKAGITMESKVAVAAKEKQARTADECCICSDDLDDSNSCILDCNHTFCDGCLTQYLTIHINEGKSLDITCMAHKCKGRIPDRLIKKLVDDKVYTKYMAFVSKSFVEDNPNIQWCPRPKCGNAVKSDSKSISEATCSCGYKFCFKCNKEAHAPATCNMMREWGKKCKDDSETSNWISANTKDCPKCHSSIEKNGGCNHMTCKKCKHEFCWICFGDWRGHSACNKYNSDESKQSQSRAALEKYLHYYHRYQAHDASSKFETKLRENAVLKMVSIQASEEKRWVDVQYIESATEQLIECRRTMKYTYVFAFYMTAGKEKNLFEYLQAELEKTTERLSGLLEADLNSYDPRELKDVNILAAKRLAHLMEGVEEMVEHKHNLPFHSSVLDPDSTSSAPPDKEQEKRNNPEVMPLAVKPTPTPETPSPALPPVATAKSGGSNRSSSKKIFGLF